ncbi:MAG: EamA family transporter [Marinobacterium sp.]|nr:EamA family transporter [Marinobacterium sp.]
MSAWILFTLMAAFMQATRTACQKTLAERSSAAAATLARSLFALPLVWLWLALIWHLSPPVQALQQTLQLMNKAFVLYSSFAALMQILATILMVQLFTQRNYAIGISYAKTEALLIAVLGLLLFDETLNTYGWLGVAISVAGLVLLSPHSGRSADTSDHSDNVNHFKTTLLGLSSGLGFALTSLAVRQAGISLGEQPLLNAAITLTAVISLQTLLLGGWMLMRRPSALSQLLHQWPLASTVGLTSMAGSVGWFSAMMMVNPALVKTLGQVEFLFVLVFSRRLFRETLSKREQAGIGCLLLSVILILQRS